ncbi:radical SAM protein [Candidatus Methanocrinis natronophilus]|uniref:Radical SAM protein n=1 Tax=Candidatus Methanocrinis natronophilus TaxID=3033396 RepID=A0ABT5X5I0_9EURY|nr:radical SAM protein [Candidatus Methanocrinis natronophilus]MDF0589954.1 radical SAM protein [Candidatus Methanocrinis natronophilus]
MKCTICGRGEAARILGVCLRCTREGPVEAEELIRRGHLRSREAYPHLPPQVPRSTEAGARVCRLCSNECSIPPGGVGYCGVRRCRDGRVEEIYPGRGVLVAYEDLLPTNCCASWFCPGSLAPAGEGRANLAVFMYGCGFNCLFCQNESHRRLESPPLSGIDAFAEIVTKSPRTDCVCYFGGSPEPQLPFALRASKRIIEARSGGADYERDRRSGDGVPGPRICWEMNGSGDPALVRRAAELSFRSGGIVKFDLKAFENFEMIAEEFVGKREAQILTATTLLVPGYVDEVEAIAEFIEGLSPDIPYSLLVFHPDFWMKDLPITPRSQAARSLEAARSHLRRVYLGNRDLLPLAPP